MNYKRNIRRAYHMATADDMAQGLAWYGIAAEFAEALALDSRLTVPQTAGAIAALQPASFPAHTAHRAALAPMQAR